MSNGRIGQTLKIEGVALTQSGRELYRIVKMEQMDDYSTQLAQFFQRNGFRMIEVSDGEPRVVSVPTDTGLDPQ